MEFHFNIFQRRTAEADVERNVGKFNQLQTSNSHVSQVLVISASPYVHRNIIEVLWNITIIREYFETLGPVLANTNTNSGGCQLKNHPV